MADQPDQNQPGQPDDPQRPPEEAAAAPASAIPANSPTDPGGADAVEDIAEKLHRGGHVVICNWNSKGEAIIKELHSRVVRGKRLVVIVTDKKLPERAGAAWRGVFTV